MVALGVGSGDQFEAINLASADCLAGSNPRYFLVLHYFQQAAMMNGDAFDMRQATQGPEPKVLWLGQLGDKTFRPL